MKIKFTAIFVIALLCRGFAQDPEDTSRVILPLPADSFIPISFEVIDGLTPQGFKNSRLSLKSRSFDIEAPLDVKGWRLRHLQNNQVEIHNLYNNEATVTLSAFDFFLYFPMTAQLEDWTLNYLNSYLLDGKLAKRVGHTKTFPNTQKYRRNLFTQFPREIIDYVVTDPESGKEYLCRDYFIDYIISENQRDILVVKLKRPSDFPESNFEALFDSLFRGENASR
ncbi:MAG: hypothetical protein ACPGN3_17855 [Opitutales bacterium]